MVDVYLARDTRLDRTLAIKSRVQTGRSEPPGGRDVTPLAVSRDGQRFYVAQNIDQPDSNVIHVREIAEAVIGSLIGPFASPRSLAKVGWARSIDGGAPVRVADGSARSVVTQAGGQAWLVAVDAKGVVALPFDLSTGRVTGAATTLVAGAVAASASAGGVLATSAAGTRPRTVPTWFDRRSLGTIGQPAYIDGIALSADGRKLARSETVVGPAGQTSAMWLEDVASGSRSRVTFEAAAARRSGRPTARTLAFTSVRGGASIRGRRTTCGSCPSRMPPARRSQSWHTDNRETAEIFSPDGRTVAYVSDESGTNNVYVRSFPSTGGRKWQVSTAGGYQPRWRGDGRELFYMSPAGQLMRVDVTPGVASAPGEPTMLFQTAVFGGGASVNNWYWDVTADGQRFLINSVIGGADPSMLNVVLNWQAGLAR